MGLARIKASQATLTNCLAEGTPNYIAPETLLQQKNRVPSDVWAFGLIIAELVTRRRAWGCLMNTCEMISLLMQKTLPDTLQDLPQPFKDVCEACLVYDTKKRATMVEVTKTLKNTSFN